jgi:hypothetical protein
MNTITTIAELRQAISQFNDNDLVVVEIHEGSRSEDLYEFHVDNVNNVKLMDGSEVTEVRICI